MPNQDRTGRAPSCLLDRLGTITDDEQVDGVLWDQSGKLPLKGREWCMGAAKLLERSICMSHRVCESGGSCWE
jgi:hypothetical protein